MIALVFVSIVAFAAIVHLLVYRAAFRNASVLIVAQQNKLDTAYKLHVESSNKLGEAFRLQQSAQRELASLRQAVVCWRADQASYVKQVHSIIDNVERDGIAMKSWAPDRFGQSNGLARPPGAEERASAETDEQCHVTKESFLADVEAAGLRVRFHACYWWIEGGIAEPWVKVKIDGNKVHFGRRYEPTRRGTVAAAIELAGPRVGTN